MFTEILTQIWACLNFLSTLLLAHLLYKRYGQGLARYPGPFLASLTNLYRLYDVIINTHAIPMLDLHRKYGKVVRYGPNMLSFSDPRAIKDIYVGNDACPKSQFFSIADLYISGEKHSTIFSATDEKWHGRMRRAVGPAFTMSSIAQLEEYVDMSIEVFMRTLEEKFMGKGEGDEEESVDVVTWMQFFAFDVLGQLVYGERHGFIEKGGDIEDIIAIADFGTKYNAWFGQMPWLDFLLLKNPLFLFLVNSGLIKMEFAVLPFAQKQIAARENRQAIVDEERRDLLDRLLETQKKNPDLLDDVEIAKVCGMLVFAGSDTTAITLAALFYHLLKNPDVYAKLQAEIDAAAHPSQTIRFAAAQALPYLDACIKETFRMHPAVGFNPERVVPAPGREIAGRFVPGGTIVSVAVWPLHRSVDVFGEDANVFRPERWIENEEKAKEMWKDMFHFGAGSHICLGRNISLLELYKLVPVFLGAFQIEFADSGNEKEWTTYNMGFVKPVGLKVKLTKRK